MTSLLLQIFRPSQLRSSQMRARSRCRCSVNTRSCPRFPAPNRFQCRDYPPVPHCCPSRDLVALAGSWASFPCCGESLSQLKCFPRLISSQAQWCAYQHGFMRGIINIDKLDKPDKSWCPNSDSRQRRLPRWEFHRALGDQVPSQFTHTWTRVVRGTRSRQSRIIRAYLQLWRPQCRHSICYLFSHPAFPRSATSAVPVDTLDDHLSDSKDVTRDSHSPYRLSRLPLLGYVD